jgi:hypothetical protein
MASLTGRLVGAANACWGAGCRRSLVESQEHDGYAYAKSIRYKAVERHKQANEVLTGRTGMFMCSIGRSIGNNTGTSRVSH